MWLFAANNCAYARIPLIRETPSLLSSPQIFLTGPLQKLRSRDKLSLAEFRLHAAVLCLDLLACTYIESRKI